MESFFPNVCLGGGVGWMSLAAVTVEEPAFLECVCCTHVCFYVPAAFCCCFLLLWDPPVT